MSVPESLAGVPFESPDLVTPPSRRRRKSVWHSNRVSAKERPRAGRAAKTKAPRTARGA